MKSRVLKEGKYCQANNTTPIVIDLERMYANAECCAKCYHLRFIRVNSKEHFYCLWKRKEITHDNAPYCKDFVDSNKYQLIRARKYSKLSYNLVWKEHYIEK